MAPRLSHLAAAAAAIAALAAAQGFGPITALPGWAGNLTMSSGYLTVDSEKGRQLFFWFVAAPTPEADVPLVLWLNGGPGCSSLSGGLFSELG